MSGFTSSSDGDGIHGESTNPGKAHTSGVLGTGSDENGIAVGVTGIAKGFAPGVIGISDRDCGVFGIHPNGMSIGSMPGFITAGVMGASEKGPGLLGYSPNGLAGQFWGDVRMQNNLEVQGDIFLPGADCAEMFHVVDEVEPGDVVVIDREGLLRRSDMPYDKRVAGVVSGAGQLRAGVMLGSENCGSDGAFPLALIGKVYCKVDARSSRIEVGDLLTTSTTLGHAMKAANPSEAFGSVLGKALADLDSGVSLLPVLVCLQ